METMVAAIQLPAMMLDNLVYDILNLSHSERMEVKSGLEELQELRRLRTQN